MKITPRPISHNYDKGRGGTKVNMVVIHIMEGYMEGTFATFNDPKRSASAHYGISLKGEIDNYVVEADTAWHCGSTYKDNQRSIGIEHEGFTTGTRWSEAQLEASAELTAGILKGYGLGLDAIVKHVDLHPLSGHTCPGKDFDMLGYKERVRSFMVIQTPPPLKPTVVKPKMFDLQLYFDSFRMGSVRVVRSTGKAFYIPQAVGAPLSRDTLKLALRQMGYGDILKD